ncbi:cation channel sperm-associated auxiliary subunit zeta isoform X10 [Rattus norvegicus]
MEENSNKENSRRSLDRSSPYGDVRQLWSTATLSTTNASVSGVCEDFDEEGKSVSKLRKHSQAISITEALNLEPEEIQQQARLELEQYHSRSLEREIEENFLAAPASDGYHGDGSSGHPQESPQ